ncbi:MAG: histidinol-phosphate transaminase, partial [Bifidobacteriaceae bacterium]|nr:histidinol-phosphate transaminase [Bifidobacteriaceae bacterium]
MTSKVSLSHAVSAVPAYVPGARPEAGRRVFKLSSNENPFPPLPGVLSALADAASDANRYPDMYAADLSAALAEHLGVDPEQVAVAGGSTPLLRFILTAVCDPGDELIYAWRSFEAYPILATLASVKSVQVPLVPETGRQDLPAMLKAVTDKTRCVFLCSPNNPTGPAMRTDEFEVFMKALPSNILVVVDEAYLDFVTDPEAAKAFNYLDKYPNLLVARTFSKAYGLAGLRVGYAVGRSRLCAAIKSAATPFGINAPAQLAAMAALRDSDTVAARVATIVERRDRFVAALRQQGWQVPDTQANFVWLPLGQDTVPFT